MKKLRIVAVWLLVLIVFLAACSVPEDTAPGKSAEYGASTQQVEASETSRDTEPSPHLESSEEAEAPPEESTPEDTGSSQDLEEPPEEEYDSKLPVYGEYYYDLVNVVLYLEIYDELPDNYITKSEARALGWEGGSVEDYMEGAAIGGDTFGNREGLLPEAKGRRYTECDIDTNGYPSRGARRLVFSNDGLYYYTADHYESFSEVTVTEDYEVIR